MLIIIIFFLAHWYLSLFSQTFFNHRYASHRAFTMTRPWERFFFIFGYLTQGSSYLSPRAYAIMHRMHHAYTDTEKDPHSPKYFRNVFTMMSHTAKIYADIYRRRVVPEQRFVKNIPEWNSFDKWAGSIPSKLIWIALYVSFYFVFATTPWVFLLLPIHVLMGPVHGVIINWFAHKYGYINFKLNNTSRNLVPVDLVMLGEAYHNDHHQYPSAINFGVKWYQIDPVYYIILLLNKMHIISLPKLVMVAKKK